MTHRKHQARALSMALLAIAAASSGIIVLNDASLDTLQARLTEINETSAAIVAKADHEKRELTAEEQTELDALNEEFEAVDSDLQRRQRIVSQQARLAEPQPRQVQAAAASAALQQQQQPAGVRAGRGDGLQATRLSTNEERQRWGFTNFGEFAVAVQRAQVGRGLDQRLVQAAATTYGSEGVGSDGGFAVPPEWRSTIMQMVDGEDSMLPRCDQQSLAGNSITFPVDETTAHQTTGGIQVYWDSEAAAANQSKPSLKDLTVKLSRLTALVPITEELLEDSTALSGYVTGKAGEKFAFKINDAIVNGTGAGMPLGILSSPCLVTVSAEGSQTAGTVHAMNVQKMVARMPASSFARSVWLINQDVWPQIMSMGNVVTNPAGTVAGGAGALWMPPNGLATSGPYGQLLGRPIIVTEACPTVGTKGDIILADLTKYLAAVKTGGVRSDVSMHLFFDQNITAFRFVLRMNGQPWLSAPISRKSGSNTLSHFVALAAR